LFYNKNREYYVKIDKSYIYLYKTNFQSWINIYSLEEKDYIKDLLGDKYNFDYDELELYLYGLGKK